MNLEISIPLDNGFLRRECPSCERQFKWYTEPTEDRPDQYEDPSDYFCPYCGERASSDAWFTTEQVEFAADHARVQMEGEVGRMLERTARDFNRRSGSSSGPLGFSVSMEYERGRRTPKPTLREPSDMREVKPLCHPWEPIKVDEGWQGDIHCLICGTVL